MSINVLTFVAYYLPGYKSGGPVRTIANMVDHLGDELNFHIITLDRDALDTKPYPDVVVNKWCQVGKAQVYYAGPSFFSFGNVVKLIQNTPYDLLYLNSFFNYQYTGLPLLARFYGQLPKRPVILAPRGELSEGALALNSWKKRPYMAVAHLVGLYRNLIWHASSNYEAGDIERGVGSQRAGQIVIAPDLPPILKENADDNSFMHSKGYILRVIFLSRITPKKNLHFALDVLSQVKVPIEFTIVGPVRDEPYWKKCQSLIKKLPSHICVDVIGSINHKQVPAIMAKSDLFFLPTLGENYGHVILEALTVGTPVLIADTTPWRGLSEAGVGWDLSLTNEKDFVDVIEFVSDFSQEKYRVWRRRVRNYAMKKLLDDKVVQVNRNLFVDSVGY